LHHRSSRISRKAKAELHFLADSSGRIQTRRNSRPPRCLVSKSTSWQYIYRKVWEGIILGQIVRHFAPYLEEATKHREILRELENEIIRFQRECGFYVGALSDALSDVITKYVRDAAKKTDALSQVELRRCWNLTTGRG